LIIHFIHYPVSAKRFVEPLVNAANDAGFNAEMWLENRLELSEFVSAISCPKRFTRFDISFNPVAIIKNIIRLRRKLNQVKPAAVHCHQSRAAFIPLASAMLAKVPVRIFHNHGAPYLGYKGFKRWTFWLLEFLNCRMATHVLMVAPTIRQKMIESKIVSEEKSQCLGAGSICGIDLDEFKIENFSKSVQIAERRKLRIASNAFVVFYIGRPFARKGFSTLLSAWEIFCKMQPETEKILLIAGCDLKDIVSAKGFCPAGVMPLGYVSQLKPYYAICDVVTLPSLHEGMPYSLLEAAAASRAIAASDIPGIDSLIRNNQNGLLIEPQNPDKFADAFNRLYTNTALRDELAGNARKDVEKLFDRKICTKLLIDYYYSIGLKTGKSG
jgi:N,N'-diacetylbacillosaminyl-diphospho-undecaprenol alpha-1,3-N-acetylgalactosaminyltransferase